MLINSSSLILPRDSKSVDMVGVEVDEVLLSSERVPESWSIDRYSFPDSAGKEGQHFASSSSSDEFFDACMETSQLRASSGSPQPFNQAPPQIPRFAVQIRQAHIITALNIQAWKQSIHVRFTVDLVINFLLIAFL